MELPLKVRGTPTPCMTIKLPGNHIFENKITLLFSAQK